MPCKLTPITGTTDFEGPAGVDITIETKSFLGVVMIARVEYAGQLLTKDGQAVSKLKVKVLQGRNSLKVVFAFVPTSGTRGELRETDGADSQFMREVSSTEEFQRIQITGK
jgi:hypothetical protein